MRGAENKGGRSDVLRPRFCPVSENTLGVLLAGGEGRRLLPLTANQAKPALSFAGEHRLVDFTLTSCVNSGLRRVIVVTCHKSESLHPYLSALTGPLRRRGLELEVTWLSADMPGAHTRGTAGAVRALLDRIHALKPRHVLVLAADHVYRMDYGPLVRFHLASGGPATVVTTEVDLESARSFGVMSVGPDDRVLRFQEKPSSPSPAPGNPEAAVVSMGLYVFDADELARTLASDATDPESSHDFGADIMPRLVERGRLRAYPLRSDACDGSGYWRDVGTITAFHRTAMELLGAPGRCLLGDSRWPLVGAAAFDGRRGWPSIPARGADIDCCLLPRDCTIGACTISHSVLSPGANVAAGAEVEESVLLPGARIGRGARVRGCIVGQYVQLPSGAEVGMGANPDAPKGSWKPTVVL